MNAWGVIIGIAVLLLAAIAWQTRHYCGCSDSYPVPTGVDDAGNPKFHCAKCGKKC